MFILVISDSSEINEEFISILCVLALHNTSLKKLYYANYLFTLICYMSIVSFIYRFQAATMLTINRIVYYHNLLDNRPVCRVARTELSWVQRPSIRQSR